MPRQPNYSGGKYMNPYQRFPSHKQDDLYGPNSVFMSGSAYQAAANAPPSYRTHPVSRSELQGKNENENILIKKHAVLAETRQWFGNFLELGVVICFSLERNSHASFQLSGTFGALLRLRATSAQAQTSFRDKRQH